MREYAGSLARALVILHYPSRDDHLTGGFREELERGYGGFNVHTKEGILLFILIKEAKTLVSLQKELHETLINLIPCIGI